MTKTNEFRGFGPEALELLAELTDHNDRAWFEANKARYEAVIREPARALIRAMGPRLAKKVSPAIVADDRKVGGSLMRVHRDVRFSKDKTPYKTNIGIQFRHEAGKDVHAPGCYLHVSLDECFLGMGVYRPDGPSLAKIRARIDEDPEGWKRASTDPKLLAVWHLGGDALKRAPRDYAADHPLIEDLKRKDHVLMADLSLDEAVSPELPALLAARFGAGKKHMKFLCDALGLRF